MNFNINAYICGNGAGEGYGEGSDEKGSIIETYIIEGAAFFLKANSDIQLYLNRIELSVLNGTDYNEMMSILNSAYDNMAKAKESYDNLIKTAEVTSYNDVVIFKLSNFNYDEFAEKNSLNRTIFKEVEGYLGRGNINGAFRNIHTKFCEIIEKINFLKGKLSLNEMVEIKIYWKLNQDFCQTLLFGQYISEVFFAIR
jgi:hypothetical protein